MQNYWRRLMVLLLAASALPTGCSVYRGLPTHGGGKRFDEEERIVAGAIRRAVADMDLKELSGRPVQITVDSISHSGGGYLTLPGVQSINAGYSSNVNDSDTAYGSPPVVYVPQLDSISRSTGHGTNISASYAPNPTYNAALYPSDPDLNYLIAAINMKARHTGALVGAPPEYMLYVMVDVLGTNRSRRDHLLFWQDRLKASCALTYYAVRTSDSTLLFRARQAAAEGRYTEDSALLLADFHTDRQLLSQPPLLLPVDGETVTPMFTTTTTTPVQLIGIPAPGSSPSKSPFDSAANPSMQAYLDARLREADLALESDDRQAAARALERVRAIDPDHPGLSDVESRLEQQREEEMSVFNPLRLF